MSLHRRLWLRSWIDDAVTVRTFCSRWFWSDFEWNSNGTRFEINKTDQNLITKWLMDDNSRCTSIIPFSLFISWRKKMKLNEKLFNLLKKFTKIHVGNSALKKFMPSVKEQQSVTTKHSTELTFATKLNRLKLPLNGAEWRLSQVKIFNLINELVLWFVIASHINLSSESSSVSAELYQTNELCNHSRESLTLWLQCNPIRWVLLVSITNQL